MARAHVFHPTGLVAGAGVHFDFVVVQHLCVVQGCGTDGFQAGRAAGFHLLTVQFQTVIVGFRFLCHGIILQ